MASPRSKREYTLQHRNRLNAKILFSDVEGTSITTENKEGKRLLESISEVPIWPTGIRRSKEGLLLELAVNKEEGEKRVEVLLFRFIDFSSSSSNLLLSTPPTHNKGPLASIGIHLTPANSESFHACVTDMIRTDTLRCVGA